MNKRIRILREDMKLSRAAFGEKLGVSGDVINNLERGRVEARDYIIKLICSEFSVNENWLRNGTDPMYIQLDTFSLDDYVRSKEASELELEIVKAYFDLDLEIRKTAMEHFKHSLITATAKDPRLFVPDTEEELKKQYSPINTKNDSKVEAR